MKKINLLLFVFVISNLFLSCATTIETVKNDSPFILKDDEGFILLRILNPNVGKVIDEFYYSNGETAKKQAPLHLNSDLQIKKAPGSFSVFTVANTEKEQLVLLKARKGSYGIIKVGENSEYFNPYVFKVEAGVVNYAGDVNLDIVTGRVLVWHKVKDYYDLSIADNFDEILNLRESSELLSIYSDFEFINQSKNVETMQPLNCHVIRDN
ncbi:MAG: hypothetical protein MR958_09420 [Spirochaetia bacterium]|jgi:hypothetical protein|nr:hypothetical protein [Spirochaetia bacterium]